MNRLFVGDKAEGLSSALSLACSYLGARTEEELACHPDYLMVSKGEKKGMGVDEANLVLEKAALMPLLSEKTIIVIHEMDCLNDRGQNILLKLLEDKNHYVRVLATAGDARMVLDTVKSRMACVECQRLSKAEFAKTCSSEPILYWLTSGYPGRLPLAEEMKALFVEIGQALDNGDKIRFFECLGLLKEKDTVALLQSNDTCLMLFNFLEGYYSEKMDMAEKQGDTEKIFSCIKLLTMIAWERGQVSNLYNKNNLFCFIKNLWGEERRKYDI